MGPFSSVCIMCGTPVPSFCQRSQDRAQPVLPQKKNDLIPVQACPDHQESVALRGRKGPATEFSSELKGQRGPADSPSRMQPLPWGWSCKPTEAFYEGPSSFLPFENACFIPQNLTSFFAKTLFDNSIVLLGLITFLLYVTGHGTLCLCLCQASEPSEWPCLTS